MRKVSPTPWTVSRSRTSSWSSTCRVTAAWACRSLSTAGTAGSPRWRLQGRPQAGDHFMFADRQAEIRLCDRWRSKWFHIWQSRYQKLPGRSGRRGGCSSHQHPPGHRPLHHALLQSGQWSDRVITVISNPDLSSLRTGTPRITSPSLTTWSWGSSVLIAG